MVQKRQLRNVQKKKGEEQDHENKFRKTCDEHFRTYCTHSLIFYVSVFLCDSAYQCNAFTCRTAERLFYHSGKHFLDNLRSVANDGSFPMFRGIINSVIVSGCSAALCTYFSSLTAYGIYAYDFKERKLLLLSSWQSLLCRHR